MNRLIKFSLAILLAVTSLPSNGVFVGATEEQNHQGNSFNADNHHNHGAVYANFLPDKLLNPDDSDYQAPESTEEYVGLYIAQASIEALGLDIKLILDIQKDGLFNLAYYFENEAESNGHRFYVSEENSVEAVVADYQDLTVLTGALRDGDGGLGSGLIRETIAPVVLLDSQGQPEELYTYLNMAYGLRENYVNARVYQNVGLYIANDIVAVDVNHLIGLDADEPLALQFELVEEHADQFLVERPTFELLQHNFDTHLVDHNDFNMSYQSANEFVQKVLAMHLETNTSFSQDTQVELVEAENITSVSEVVYAMLINESILYVSDGERLYMATEFEENEGQYKVEAWVNS